MAGLQLKQVAKRYGATTVIHSVDLEVKDGETHHEYRLGPWLKGEHPGGGPGACVAERAQLRRLDASRLHRGARLRLRRLRACPYGFQP